MVVAAMEIRLHASWVRSLKEKRMIVKSLVERIRNRYNVSAAEVDTLDAHQSIVIGIACVAWDAASADRTLDHLLEFVEKSTDAEITEVSREIL